MSAQQSPFLGVNYGWILGEDGWNLGMDDNLLKISAFLYKSVDDIVSTVPVMSSGQMYYNSTNNTLNYNINGLISSVAVPVGFTFSNKNTGMSYTLTPSGLSESFDQSSGDARYIQQSMAGTFGLTLLATATAAAARSAMGLGTASTQPTAFFEQAITAGTATQYWRGDKTFQDFATSVRVATLTGLVTSSSAVVTAADTVITAFGKLQAQLALKSPSASPVFTGIPTAPTASVGTSTGQLATTQFVANAVSATGSLAQLHAVAISFQGK